MLLFDLFPKESKLDQNLMATGVSADSRNISPGMIFVAIKGTVVDGHDYIDAAIKAGAIAVVAEDHHDTGKVPLIISRNSRLSLSKIAASLSGRQPNMIAAITGTNGKTSVADFLRQIWKFTGWHSASLGTLGVRGDGLGQIADMSSLTTPDAVSLHQSLAEMAKSGISNLAIEASSHGIEQDRLSGVNISAAGFTNLSRDHLDHHLDMESYFAAKARLFTELLPDGGTAVINIDDEYGQRLVDMLAARQVNLVTIGHAKQANLQILSVTPFDGGMTISVKTNGVERVIPLALMGDFQAENALMAAGLAYASGLSIDHAILTLPYLKAAPGRMQTIPGLHHGGKVIVDFAHTPDALAIALKSLRSETAGKLGVVFGCGGDRDQGKRAEMGKIAHEHADFTIITDDNPRSEDPASIRQMIADACPNAEKIADRHKAITAGVAKLEGGDVLLVAGKGHESNQLIGSESLPFSDAAEVAAIIANIVSNAPLQKKATSTKEGAA